MSWSRRRFLQSAGVVAAAECLAGDLRLLAADEGIASRMAQDPRRPQFHLLPAANWMNDPNAPIYWKGEYHMYFQYNPGGAYWGDMHWAHAVSRDTVHWRHRPVALAPTPGGPDADGCFSGSAVVLNGAPAIIYTAVKAAPPSEATLRDGKSNLRETQCVATAGDASLNSWSKLEKPVIAVPPAGMAVTGFRDPCPWRLGDWWYLNVGSGMRGRGGSILLYRSRDFHTWEYLHPLVEGAAPDPGAKNIANPVDSGEMWECPDFFELGGKYVLIYSAQGRVFWQSGTLDTAAMRFLKERDGVLDHGSFYAPKTQVDATGKRLLWGWIPETRPEAEYRAAGWAGMMSLPRVLEIDGEGQLRIRFSPALVGLRGSALDARDATRGAAAFEFRGCAEGRWSVRRCAASFRVTLSPKDREGAASLTVAYDPKHPGQVEINGKAVELKSKDAALTGHFFVDGSVIECVLNEEIAYTQRFYYAGREAPAMQLVCQQGQSDGDPKRGERMGFTELAVWPLRPISTDRLTT